MVANYIDTAKDVIVSFTEFTKIGGILTKKISYTPQGEFRKDPSECWMSSGAARTVRLKFSEFPEYLQGVQLNQAIAHGICGYDKVKIVSADNFSNQPGTITRTKDFFHYNPDGPALGMIDYDPDDGQPQRTYEDVIYIINSVCPGFADIPKVLTYSTSSCIYNGHSAHMKNDFRNIYGATKNNK